MTTKQLKNYAYKKLENHGDVFFFVNTKRIIKPYAPNGEKYGIAYADTYKLIAAADNIDKAKAMIDDYINHCKERDLIYKTKGSKNL